MGYWGYSTLDYQNKESTSQDQAYQLSTPEFIKTSASMFSEQEKHTMINNIWSNPNFSEDPINKFMKGSGQISSKNYFSVHPVFHLIDIDGKQTNFRLIADLSTIKKVKSVTFPTWGEKEGPGDLKMYEGIFDPDTNTWQVTVQVKDHGEAGLYKSQILVRKENGKVEETEFGQFLISEPSLEATVDTSRVSKGQFSVNITVNSVADVEKLSIPIWSKNDQSDVAWYEGERQEDGTYKANMDYEKHQFNNGTYTANVYLTTANGLKVEKNAGSAEIHMSHPVRIRLLQNTTIFQDRALTKIKKEAAINSMAYVKGIVFNGEEKIYKTTEGYILAKDNQVNEMAEDIRYVAHRGNKKSAPENSLPAFQQANTWGVETDIWLTKDKHWVVMHDESVDRMTNGKGKVSDLTLEQIRALRIRSGSNVTSYDESQLIVPTLEDYLVIMRDYQKTPFIEIKPKALAPSDYDSLIQLIGGYGFSASARVISFDFNNLVEMKKRMPGLQVQFLTNTLNEQTISQVSSLGSNAGLDIEYKDVLSKIEMVTKAQSQGLLVNLWVVPKSNLDNAKALGVDNLTVNF
ncbi:glycerophosphodiester phosphodiesterase family protein [Enterococcus rivorum]|uniref:glycerophosphodiester phosphodiesterase family protein n=1 Tax=Enterococcus rivorum TaxID=762845 RepID=UPI001112EDC0|nr:glycerophosphodiester phosphodiesterase family protein [Enterococcus rivorum]MBP2097962.1 glycerophosphoryl diester phosphodiesterase [Enterococcus rivorum]